MSKLQLFSLGMILLIIAGCTPVLPAKLPTALPTASQVLATNTPSATNIPPATRAVLPSPSATVGRIVSSPRPTLLPTMTRVAPTPTWTRRVTVVPGASCPFNIPVKVVAPGPDPNHFAWSAVIQPMDDPCVDGIAVDPRDERLWYVSGQHGLYITRDGGRSWEHPLTNAVLTAPALSPDDPNLVYAASLHTVYLSSDRGKSWKGVGEFPASISLVSLTVTHDGIVHLGANWGGSATPNGIYVSRDRGVNWQLLPFTPPQKGLISWSIHQDPRDGTLYVGNEIYDHPQPYHPPFFRSKDGGKTWEEISGDTINWHVLRIQVNPKTGYVFALTEGAGLYGSSDHGDHWKALGRGGVWSLLLDPKYPSRLFAGSSNGVFLSTDEGAGFTQIGLYGVPASSLSLNGDSTMLYAACYASGIYLSRIPEEALPR